APASAATQCLKVLIAQHRDEAPVPRDFALTPCATTRTHTAFYYDREAHLTRLRRDLSVGEIVSTYPEVGSAVVRPGDTLSLVTRIGKVRIERRVVALQAARTGETLFVRTPEGDIVTARFQENMQ